MSYGCVLRDEWRFVSYGTSSLTGRFVSYGTSGLTGHFVSYGTSGPTGRLVSNRTNGAFGNMEALMRNFSKFECVKEKS